MPRNADHLMQYRFGPKKPKKPVGGRRRPMPAPRPVPPKQKSPSGGGFGRIASY